MYGDVGEIWTGTSCVVESFSVVVEMWIWGHEKLVHEERRSKVGWYPWC